MIFSFLKGALLGLGLVMPLGPLNLFILNNSSLQTRYVSILPVVFTSALCDAMLILSATWGVDIISQIAWFKPVMTSIGIIFLAYMGITMWVASSRPVLEPIPARPVPTQVLYSATLSIFNPHAIMDTFLIIGGVSATFVGYEKHAFAFGCVFIDFAWFAFLGTLGYWIRQFSMGPRIFFFINKISSMIMIFLALQLLLT